MSVFIYKCALKFLGVVRYNKESIWPVSSVPDPVLQKFLALPE